MRNTKRKGKGRDARDFKGLFYFKMDARASYLRRFDRNCNLIPVEFINGWTLTLKPATQEVMDAHHDWSHY